MNFTALTNRTLSLFSLLGGWRTVIEGIASRALFAMAYQLTADVLTSALVAVGGVVVLAVIRVCTDRKFWQAAVALVMVGVSALLAGNTGQGEDFYLIGVLTSVAAATILLVSILVRWPVVGIAVGAARGERFAWRRDRGQVRRYQLCTAVFLTKFVLASAAQVPLYLAGEVVALGVVTTLLNPTAIGLCGYVCWRILREE